MIFFPQSIEDVSEFKKKYRGRKFQFIEMHTINADQLFDILDDGNGHFIMGYCYSDIDKIVKSYTS